MPQKTPLARSVDLLLRVLPGLGVMGLILSARVFGLLEPLELFAFDLLLRLRPHDGTSDRITIVKIDEADVSELGGYPIPQESVAEVISQVQQHQPAVVGVNILSDLLEEQPSEQLRAQFQTPTLIAAEKILLPQIAPLSGIPPEQVGFSDIYVDPQDTHLRRIILGVPDPLNNASYKFAFAIRLAAAYLEPRDHELLNGIADPQAMRFGDTEIPRLNTYTGGYVGRIDNSGVQALMNFRNGPDPFPVLTRQELAAGAGAELIQGRIVIIGVSDGGARLPIKTDAIASDYRGSVNRDKVDAVDIQAHATSQIVSATLDGRPLLKSWSEPWEYAWILLWGALGLAVWVRLLPPGRILMYGLISSGALITAGYLAMLGGYWIPVVPPLLLIAFNGFQCVILNEYQGLQARSRERRRIANERQRTIKQAFNIIHNGPLQNLASLMRSTQDEDIPKQQLVDQLIGLDAEIRQISDYLISEAFTKESSFYLQNDTKLDLKLPLHELFYQVFTKTLERDLVGFRGIKIKMRSFEPLTEDSLDFDRKRELCRFLEEMLCNIGKHAIGTSRIQATGKVRDDRYVLRVEDNGPGLGSSRKGEGTKQAHSVASLLGGAFKRQPNGSRGTGCELTWPLKSA
ncbi:MAG: CHASE2 domain-containing protein [Cyanobacteria bacterium P01_A01_bin.135]